MISRHETDQDWVVKCNAWRELRLGKNMRRLHVGNYQIWVNWGNVDTRQKNCGKHWSFSFYKFGHPFHSSKYFSWTLVSHDADCNTASQEQLAGGTNSL